MGTAAAAVKERPILFNGPMVRVILDGRKTQTRRVVKGMDGVATVVGRNPNGELDSDAPREIPEWQIERLIESCPYGKPGDRLWVRETWWQNGYWACDTWHGWTPTEVDNPDCGRRFDPPLPGYERHWRKRSPIHMPRWASRMTLEIESVRVQRLQEISEADAVAEGAVGAIMGLDGPSYDRAEKSWCRATKTDDPDAGQATARGAFFVLWDTINGKSHPWQSNPFVWAVTFRRAD